MSNTMDDNPFAPIDTKSTGNASMQKMTLRQLIEFLGRPDLLNGTSEPTFTVRIRNASRAQGRGSLLEIKQNVPTPLVRPMTNLLLRNLMTHITNAFTLGLRCGVTTDPLLHYLCGNLDNQDPRACDEFLHIIALLSNMSPALSASEEELVISTCGMSTSNLIVFILAHNDSSAPFIIDLFKVHARQDMPGFITAKGTHGKFNINAELIIQHNPDLYAALPSVGRYNPGEDIIRVEATTEGAGTTSKGC